MSCPERISQIQAYSDGELDLVHGLELEKHFGECPSCKQAHENLLALRVAIGSSNLYHSAPAVLRRNIRDAVRAQSRNSRPNALPWWHILKMAFPIAGVALIALLLLPSLSRRSDDERAAQEVVSSHVRSLMLDHKTDVASSDKHTVKPWFQGKLDFSPPVPDLADRGFPLIGGRLDYMGGRPVAALVYQCRQHLINVFVWPATGRSLLPEKSSALQGFNLVRWNASGMVFWAVSDLNQKDLESFTRLMR